MRFYFEITSLIDLRFRRSLFNESVDPLMNGTTLVNMQKLSRHESMFTPVHHLEPFINQIAQTNLHVQTAKAATIV